MRTISRAALVCASAAVVVGAAVAWSVNTPATVAPAPEAPRATVAEATAADDMVTLVLHATGDADTRVFYTCVKAGKVAEDPCGPDPVPTLDVWVKEVTVPAGTTVRVEAVGGTIQPWCSITDETDVHVLHEDHESGDCLWIAK